MCCIIPTARGVLKEMHETYVYLSDPVYETGSVFSLMCFTDGL